MYLLQCSLLLCNRANTLGSSVLPSQKSLWFQSPLYTRASSPCISRTPPNVLWSKRTFRIAVIHQQKGHRAGGEKMRKGSDCWWLTALHTFTGDIWLQQLTSSSSFFPAYVDSPKMLDCACPCWSAGVIYQQQTWSGDVCWCKFPTGMAISTKLIFQSEEFSKSQWEWCKMKCRNPNEMQLKFRKAWFSFLFIQNNEFLSWFTMAFSLLSLFECCLLGVIIHNSVVSTMGPWSLGGLQIPRNNMNLARIMCCVRCSCESSTVWER